MISFGNKAVTGLYYGDKAVTAAYFGDKPVWSGGEPRAVKFTALEDSALSTQSFGSAPSISVEYSLDGKTWSPLIANETWISVDAGDVCYVRGVGNERWSTGYDGNGTRFRISGRVKASGLLPTLLDKDANEISTEGSFHELFYGAQGLVDARDLVLPP